MDFTSLLGQDVLERILRRALSRGTVAHAYLFHGEAGLGMEAAAWVLARCLLCQNGTAETPPGGDEENPSLFPDQPCEDCPGCRKTRLLDHPDLRIVMPLPAPASGKEDDDPAEAVAEKYLEALKNWREDPYSTPRVEGGRQILVAQARHLKKWASLRSFEGRHRVAIITEVERMGIQAQNALLKLLEEPPEHLVLLLCSRQPEALLPTILSRCQSLTLRPAPLSVLEGWIDRAGLARDCGMSSRELAQLSGGNPGRAMELARELAGQAEDTVWRPVAFLQDLLAGHSDGLYRRITAMEESRDRDRLRGFLEELQSWLMDAELVRLLGAEARPLVVHANQFVELERFSGRFLISPVDEAVEELATAIRHCDRNVHMFILLNSLSHALRGRLEPIEKRVRA